MPEGATGAKRVARVAEGEFHMASLMWLYVVIIGSVFVIDMFFKKIISSQRT